MKKRKIQQTSFNAFQSINTESLDNTYVLILKALHHLKSASAEQIARYLGKEHEQINRRVSELERQNKIHRNGKQVLTSKGRLANCWELVGNMNVVDKPIVQQMNLF